MSSSVATDRSREWAVISGLLAALSARGLHSPERVEEVGRLAGAVATRLGCSEQERLDLAELAALHDIGLIGVSEAIVGKVRPLSPAERAELCTHPRIGASILHSLGDLGRLAPYVEHEHEQWDGAGYPDGLVGEDIPLLSRILLACDAYVAMQHPRPDRPALGRDTAVAVLQHNAGTQFCPRCVEALVAELHAVRPAVVAPKPEPEPKPKPEPQPAPRVRRTEPLPPRLSLGRFLTAASVGAVAGALLALPPPDVAGRCPAPGEGRSYCVLEKAWLPVVIEIVAAIIVCVVVAQLVLVTLPRWRRGELHRHESPWPDEQDKLLAAASWMLTFDDANPKRRRDR